MTALRKRHWRWWLAAFAVIAVLALNAPALHLLGWHERTDFAAETGNGDVGAVFVSGDMGLHFGISGDTARGLAAHGYPVTSISSPVAFAQHLTRAQTDEVVIDAIDEALRKGARKVVLVGQSFGSDIIATVLPDMPTRLRDKIASVVIVVPSNNVHFRADPSGIAYIGTPDAMPAKALRTVNWTPVTCIQGTDEPASLCPLLQGSPVRSIALPGNHYLQHDVPRVLATILTALHRT